MAWGVGKNVAIKADTIKHQIIKSDKAYYGMAFSKLREAQKNPELQRAKVTDFTPANFMSKGATFKPHDKGPLEDPLLVDMGASAVSLPEREDEGILTIAIKFAMTWGFNDVHLSQIEDFIAEHNLDKSLTPMVRDADKVALAAVRASLEAANQQAKLDRN